jgi:hypothetical protein
MVAAMAGQKGHGHTVQGSGDDCVGGGAKRGVNPPFLGILQRLHLIETAAAQNANGDRVAC